MRTAAELATALDQLSVPANAYSLGREADEAYCLVQEDGSWHVFYGERGNRNNENTYALETAACEDLLERILADGAIRAVLG